ncbi:MAG TPA: polysaccharide biosynthesis/export family protein [Longimicrobiales bacterium]
MPGYFPGEMIRPAYRLLMTASAFVVLAGSAAAQQPVAAKASQEFVQPGDVVKLWIWREEALSGDFLVPETGVVVFPKIGAQQVTERPMAALRDALLAEFQKYLRNPSIEITFLRRVNVLGAVRKPGVYPLDPTMTVAMALAMAEGTTPEGRSDRVELIRGGERLIANINQRTKIAELPIRSGDQLFVPERSWMSRNTPLVAALISGAFSAIGLVIALNAN